VQLNLDDDLHVFGVAGTRRLESRWFAAPVDLAPAVPEVANPAFASNTTLAGGSDMYVANRRSGTIVRVAQDGRIVAVAQIALPGLGVVGAGQLNGIAVSPDAGTIWVSLSGARMAHRRLDGSVLEVPAFGAPS
jgi:sugar lactone lactonase YvrE